MLTRAIITLAVMSATPLVDLRALLDIQLSGHPLETAFHGCVKHVLVPDGRGRLPILDTLKPLLTSSTQEGVAELLSQMVSYLSFQTNHQRVTRLTAILHTLAASGLIKARLLCEELLINVDIKNELVWSESLELIKNVIGGVEYKGCRDIMNMLLDRYDKLPRNIPEEQISALLKGQELLSRILDRNSSLLPAYFAADAIQRHYQSTNENGRQPHWVLQEVVQQLQDSMKTTADMVSGIVQPHLRPVLGVTNMSINAWRLDPMKHCCALKGLLPYRESFRVTQGALLYHVLAQQNSKDTIHSVLGVNRTQPQPNVLVEDSLVELGLVAMELSEVCVGDQEQQAFECWSHFASQLVYCHFLQLINITTLLGKLRSKLSHVKQRKGRDWLMWSLLHFSSTVQNKAEQPTVMISKEFVPIVNLFTLLYKDNSPLPVPDPTSPDCVYKAAAASIWVVYSNKAQGMELPTTTPHLLKDQIQWILDLVESPVSEPHTNYTIPLLLNIYSNNNEISSKLLDILLSAMIPSKEGGSTDQVTTPIPLWALNSLAMHAKIRLMEMIKSYLIKVVKSFKATPTDTTTTITPGLLETYSRLLVWLGTRNFQASLIPAVFESQSWGILHALLEIIVFRVHLQLQYSYRFQLLQQLHTVASVSIIPAQLYSSTENAALKLIRGLNSPEFLIQLAKANFALDPKQLLSVDSEELNRVFVLVVAQSLHTSNIDPANWLDQFMRTVLTTAPNCWSANTLNFFPSPLRLSCSPCSHGNGKAVLGSKVNDETKRFMSLSSEVEQIRLFTETDSAHLFLCVLWKLLVSGGSVNPVLVKVAQRTQPKKLAAFMRKLVDYVMFTLPQPTQQEHIDNVAQRLRELVWQYNLFPIDRLALCMLLRGYEADLEVACLSIVCRLLLISEELHNRVNRLVEMVPGDYWSQTDWNKKHASYNSEFPESFRCDVPTLGQPLTTNMPMYFGNVCLRLLPVFDLLIQRLLEVSQAAELYLLTLLDTFKMLYKYHDQPVTFLYFTLHYYDNAFKTHPNWKLRLVADIIGAQRDVHPMRWYLTDQLTDCLTHLHSHVVDQVVTWRPPDDHFSALLERLMCGLKPFHLSGPVTEWHFSEFSGAMAFTLYTTMVEVMILPLPGQQVIKKLLATLYDKAGSCDTEDEILPCVNALALVIVSLPEPFQEGVYDEVVRVMSSPCCLEPSLSSEAGSLLSLLHAYWQHANMGLLLSLPQWMNEVLKPVVKTEDQLLFVCRVFGPLLNRLTNEKPKLLLDVVMEIYKLLQVVDGLREGHMIYSDLICDYLYHIKYMHIGERSEIEAIILTLHNPIKLRLRFLQSDKTNDPVPTPPPPGN